MSTVLVAEQSVAQKAKGRARGWAFSAAGAVVCTDGFIKDGDLRAFVLLLITVAARDEQPAAAATDEEDGQNQHDEGPPTVSSSSPDELASVTAVAFPFGVAAAVPVAFDVSTPVMATDSVVDSARVAAGAVGATVGLVVVVVEVVVVVVVNDILSPDRDTTLPALSCIHKPQYTVC